MIPMNRLVEYSFFFGLLGIVAYMAWSLIAPFVSALALAAILVTICYPMYERILRISPKRNATVAALVTTLVVIVLIILPLLFLGSFLLDEAIEVYGLFGEEGQLSAAESLGALESFIESTIPGFELNIPGYVQQVTGFIAANITSIFAGTASTIFSLFIALIASFYFFRDGKTFTKYLVEVSPLPDDEDELILRRLARSVRSVALGTVLVALIQGTLTAIGLSFFGFERAILWGSVASIGALIPGIGTSIVFIPAIIYLLFTGSYMIALGVAIWAALAVGLIDNFLGPYLMSRGGPLHPFVILLSVLGGIIFFGPIGFVLGPVIMSLLKVLLDLYMTHIASPDDT